MIFLIAYDRTRGEIVRLDRFDAAARDASEAARLQLEIFHARDPMGLEIVSLEAPDLDQIKRTHRRFFESIESLATAGGNWGDQVASLQARAAS
jgi:hypothetical protein